MGRPPLALSVLILGLALAGCSGDDREETPLERSSPEDGVWTVLPALREKRPGYSDLEGVLVDGKAVVIAGASYKGSQVWALVFDPAAKSWEKSPAPLRVRFGATVVSTGDEVIVLGGCCRFTAGAAQSEGARFDPASGRWREMAASPLGAGPWTSGAIDASGGGGRVGGSAVWTGEEVLIWGGSGSAEGAAYDPDEDSWRALPPAPLSGRSLHSAVWTGEEMIVWGGQTQLGSRDFELLSRDGAAYDPGSDSWRSIKLAPVRSREGNDGSEAVWTGEEMIIWNGSQGSAFDPVEDEWRPIPRPPLDLERSSDTAIWTGKEMIIWGGDATGGADGFEDGAAYSPEADGWVPLPPSPLSGRYQHAAVWTGEEMIVWGGCCAGNGQLAGGASFIP